MVDRGQPVLGLPVRVGLYALMLSCAGIPLYLHLPRYVALQFDVSLAMLGGVLIALRLLDAVQDPLWGRLVDRFARHGAVLAALAAGAMAVGFAGLFLAAPEGAGLWWLIPSLVLIFSGFSLGSVLFYSRSDILSAQAGGSLLRLASWRELGGLIGVLLAAMAPDLLGGFAGFGWLLLVVVAMAAIAAHPLWRFAPGGGDVPFDWQQLRSNRAVFRLLLLAFVNALPMAFTANLFVFFVEDGLGLADQSGLLLVLYFIASAAFVPVWRALAARFGARRALIAAMLGSMISFIWAALLPIGAFWPFAAICVLSGAMLGAELVILPALFAARLKGAGLAPGQGFGLWAFMGKLALAMAAAIALPALGLFGFQAGQPPSTDGRFALVLFYAVLPCLLKGAAVGLVLMEQGDVE